MSTELPVSRYQSLSLASGPAPLSEPSVEREIGLLRIAGRSLSPGAGAMADFITRALA